MKKQPFISVIIPTLNRKQVLAEALLSFNKVAYPRDRLELVLVSDGSTDGTDKMVTTIKKKLNYHFVFVKKARGGISAAKNAAIKKSRGQIIVSTDDDCLFESKWLQKLTAPFADPRIGSVGGPDRAIKKESILAKSIDFAFSSFIGSGGIHGRFLKVKLGNFYPVGCNMAFRRSLVKKIGYFDESLAPGEETDFNHRIEKAGFKIVLVREAFVWHRPRNSIKRFIPFAFKRGMARVEIVRRHRQYAELIYFLPAIMILVAACLLLLGFFFSIFWKLFVGLLMIYLLLIFSAGFSSALTYRHPLYFFSVPFLIFLQHALHGSGFWFAFIKLIEKK